MRNIEFRGFHQDENGADGVDKDFTKESIIKALECCVSEGGCNKCPLKDYEASVIQNEDGKIEGDSCLIFLKKKTKDFIATFETQKQETIITFGEKLKARLRSKASAVLIRGSEANSDVTFGIYLGMEIANEILHNTILRTRLGEENLEDKHKRIIQSLRASENEMPDSKLMADMPFKEANDDEKR